MQGMEENVNYGQIPKENKSYSGMTCLDGMWCRKEDDTHLAACNFNYFQSIWLEIMSNINQESQFMTHICKGQNLDCVLQVLKFLE